MLGIKIFFEPSNIFHKWDLHEIKTFRRRIRFPIYDIQILFEFYKRHYASQEWIDISIRICIINLYERFLSEPQSFALQLN